jgi:RHS repeat-associated protein
MESRKITYYQAGEAKGQTAFFSGGRLEKKEGALKNRYNYYPGGLTFNSYQRSFSKANNFLYQGKELEEETQLYDFNARMYDAAIWRTPTLDPLADQFYDQSPYSFQRNNPIRFIDPTGMEALDVIFVNNQGEELGRIITPGEDVEVNVDTNLSLPEPITVDPSQISEEIGVDVDAAGISFEYSGVMGGGLTGGIDFTYIMEGDDAGNVYSFSRVGGAVGVDGEIGASGFGAVFNREANNEFFNAKGMEGKYNGYSGGFFVSGSYSWSNEDNKAELYPAQKSTTTWKTYNVGGGIGGEIGGKWFSGDSKLRNNGNPLYRVNQ